MIEQKENLIGSKSVPNAPKRQHPSRNKNKQSDQILSGSVDTVNPERNKSNDSVNKSTKKEVPKNNLKRNNVVKSQKNNGKLKSEKKEPQLNNKVQNQNDNSVKKQINTEGQNQNDRKTKKQSSSNKRKTSENTAHAVQKDAKKLTKKSNNWYSKKKNTKPSIKVAFLGGLNEIGKNITLFECEGDMFVLDCGMTFPDGEMLGVHLVKPDF